MLQLMPENGSEEISRTFKDLSQPEVTSDHDATLGCQLQMLHYNTSIYGNYSYHGCMNSRFMMDMLQRCVNSILPYK